MAALLTEPTELLAAEKVGCTATTLRRWLKQPHFAAEYRRARCNVLAAAIVMAQKACRGAVRLLARQMASGDEKVAAAAAKALLDFGRGGTEFLDLATRLDRVEALLGEGGDAHETDGQAGSPPLAGEGAPEEGPPPNGEARGHRERD